MTDSPTDPRLAALARWALANPEEALLRLKKPAAERSLLEFVRLMWPVLEPGRPFVSGWVIEAVAAHLEAVTDGKLNRLLINVPPGFCKSLLSSVFWPAWEWGPRNKPHLRHFSSSYSENLTLRDNAKCLKLIQSDVYQKLWGDRVHLDPKKTGERKFALLETGWKLASSVTGTGTGERGDRVVLDDLLSAQEVASDASMNAVLQYFTEVIPTRVNDDQSAIVLIMQRLHERDPAGHVLSHDLAYDRLIIPMEYEPDHPFPSRTALGFEDPRTRSGELAWPERFSKDFLERDVYPTLRSWGGEFAVSSQMQQRPAPRGGGLFKLDNLTLCNRQDVPRGDDVRGWDLAASKDGRAAYTVGALVRRGTDNRYYVLDVRRGRWTPGEVRREILQAARDDGCPQDLPQDPGQAGVAQKADFANLLDGYPFWVSTESGSKEDRARPLASQIEVGNVSVVRGAWNDALLRELETFPAGMYKDQVDALSRAHSRLMRNYRASPGAAAECVTPEPIDDRLDG